MASTKIVRRFTPLQYSLTKQFIFIHVPKTAGTSIGRLLRPYALAKTPKTQFRRVLSKLPIPEQPEKAYRPVHASARWVRLKYGAERFDAFYSFAVVRNPYDLFVSRYNYILNRERHHSHRKVRRASFLEYARAEKRKLIFGARDQMSMLDDGAGRIIVKNLFRFENLDRAAERICADLGISQETTLPKVNDYPRDHYSTYYDDESRAIVETIYKRDLEAFGYGFNVGCDSNPVVSVSL